MPSKRRSTKRPYGQAHPELDVDKVRSSLGARREVGPRGEEYFVAVPRPNEKVYTCPACAQDIPGDLAHVVAWPAEDILGPESAAAQRRHWHKACWERLGRSRG